MTAANPFQPAVKSQIKARVALDGPTGSGKTWTALKWATVLAGDAARRPNGMANIAYIDTERRSASLYAPHFTFDVVNFAPPYDVPALIATLRAAEANGYAVCVIDSWSHFWEGEGGVLDEVDAAGARSGGNSFAGWKHGTPLQRNMVDVILGLDMHVIACMRSKMEYVLQEYTDSKGNTRSRPVKMGMQPVQRAGVEYEFQIVGDMDLDHRITISKSRCDVLADQVIQPHRETEAAEKFLAWLDDGVPPADPAVVEAMVATMNTIEDDAERKATKLMFADLFGSPATLRTDQVEEADAWIAERVAQIAAESGEAPEADPAPADGASPDGSEAAGPAKARSALRRVPAGQDAEQQSA